MLDVFIQLFIFFLKITIVVVAVLITLVGIIGLISRQKIKASEKPQIIIRELNQYYDELADSIKEQILSKKAYKQFKKKEKKRLKEREERDQRKRIFVLDFDGDMRASAVGELREEITAIIHVATTDDEVVVRLESSGGLVPHYGLAASQLQRIKDRGIPLTVTVDKIAASGGYMMACVAQQILAAPFAIIGSIGVIAQLPNFNRLLKKHDIDFEQIRGGEFKRTLSLFGENTSEGRKKLQEEIDETHRWFKHFVQLHRPQLDIDQLSTGEHWLGSKALELNLVDEIMTSDDYLLQCSEVADLYEVDCRRKKKWYERMTTSLQSLLHYKIS